MLRLPIAAKDIGPPPPPVDPVARKAASVAAAPPIGHELRQRPSRSHQKIFHIVLEHDQPLNVAEGERPRMSAFDDDELISLVRLFTSKGQAVVAPAECP